MAEDRKRKGSGRQSSMPISNRMHGNLSFMQDSVLDVNFVKLSFPLTYSAGSWRFDLLLGEDLGGKRPLQQMIRS